MTLLTGKKMYYSHLYFLVMFVSIIICTVNLLLFFRIQFFNALGTFEHAGTTTDLTRSSTSSPLNIVKPRTMADQHPANDGTPQRHIAK